jgi:hypothetical protein
MGLAGLVFVVAVAVPGAAAPGATPQQVRPPATARREPAT